MIGSTHHWSPGPRCWETVFELLGKGLGKPLLGLSDAQSSWPLGTCVRAPRVSRRARSCARRSSSTASRNARVLATHTPFPLCAEYPLVRTASRRGTTAGKFSTQSGLQIRLKVPGSVCCARRLRRMASSFPQTSPQFLHFRAYRALDARAMRRRCAGRRRRSPPERPHRRCSRQHQSRRSLEPFPRKYPRSRAGRR